MNNIKKILGTIVAVALIATAGLGMNTGVIAKADEQSETYSVKDYVPDKYDFVDFWKGVGDIDPKDGDGVTTFAHAGLVTPLKGDAIEFNTSFKLLSKNSVANGGNDIDGWVTYSFSKTPADSQSGDKSFPYHGGAKDGIFFHITNYSGTTAPNCVEMQIVQVENEETTEKWKNFVDNILDVRMTFSLAKGENGKYTLTLTKMSDGSELKKIENLDLDESLFINENGQTYFSTAIYEGTGCDGEHWNHRGVSVYSVKAYNADITADCVALSQSEYTFAEGETYSPDVTVTVGGEVLKKGEDYAVTYENNSAVGTATATIKFFSAYGGNVVQKTYNIKADEKPVEPDDSSVKPDDSSVKPDDSSVKPDSGNDQVEDCGSCNGSMAGVSVLGIAALAGAMYFLLRRKIKE